MHLHQAWTGLTNSPLFGITLTLLAYQGARTLWTRTRGHSLANPVLVAIAVTAGFLLLTHVDYATYLRGSQYIAFLLGPATVALALPLYRQADRIRQSAPVILAAVVVGSIAAIVAGILVVRLTGGSPGTRVVDGAEVGHHPGVDRGVGVDRRYRTADRCLHHPHRRARSRCRACRADRLPGA